MDYKSAGVNIEKADNFIKGMKNKIKETFKSEVLSDIGGFSGFFDLSNESCNSPVLVSSVDGVGTKLKLAFLSEKYSTIGIDLVAMVVNDIIVTGAKPLFLLDYFATGKLEEPVAKQVLTGIIEGCKEAQCALIGGETAEMPGFYMNKEFDLAAFGVGIVDKEKIIDGSTIAKKNKIIGIASSGAHSNGYSLLRKVFIESNNFNINEPLDTLAQPLIDELLTPTKIYVKPILHLLKNFQINGMAHITGGGFTENIPRVLPDRTKAIIDCHSWEIPDIFKLTQKYGKIDANEMFRTFNNGIGFIIIVPEKTVDEILTMLETLNYKGFLIGEIIERKKSQEKIELLNYKSAFK